MEFLTSSILSGLLYDSFVNRYKVTASFLKEKLHTWIFDDQTIETLSERLNEMHLDELGEHIIKKRIDASPEILHLIGKIRLNNTVINSIIQTHSGYGDNIAGNKVTNNK